MLATLLRLYSYLFHLALTLFLLIVSSLVMFSETSKLRLDILPWKGDELVNWTFWGSLFGFFSLVLAITGRFRYLFPVWALMVLAALFRGYLLSPYTFSGAGELMNVSLFLLGALLAFLGSLTGFRSDRRWRR